jgi:hypothetical protein
MHQTRRTNIAEKKERFISPCRFNVINFKVSSSSLFICHGAAEREKAHTKPSQQPQKLKA